MSTHPPKRHRLREKQEKQHRTRPSSRAMTTFHPSIFHRRPPPPPYQPFLTHLQHLRTHTLTALEPLAVLYTLYITLDLLHQLLTKRTTLAALLRSHSPGAVWLLLGAGVYTLLNGVEVLPLVAAMGVGRVVVEGIKVLLLGWVGRWVFGRVVRLWTRGFQGKGRRVREGSDGSGVDVDEEEIRRVREERLRALERGKRRSPVGAGNVKRSEEMLRRVEEEGKGKGKGRTLRDEQRPWNWITGDGSVGVDAER
ncbi:hypothetical protein FN846DRAFT_924680 [Sphaerosporella brunnea]|uniref:Uncharacterized protein n=1 Tax=Sphaerosporella brunnea TaxID=1250544 RepID=A0A5J5FCC4_9PEZI|nr:hypothetical protein FN846DRAFT_924680 [Sphaerosporella brunnea]